MPHTTLHFDAYNFEPWQEFRNRADGGQQIGARASRQVFFRGLDALASFGVGLQRQIVRTTLPLFLGQAEDSGIAPRLAVGLGLSYRIGPGRALAQLELDWASSQVARLAGSTSSFQGTIGYLITVR